MKALIRITILCLAGMGVGTGCTNFHVVEADRLYRSAQLGPADLAATIKFYSLRSILNLRGASKEKKWYREEAKVAQDHGVVLKSVRLSARRFPTREELIEVIEAFEKGPYPMLVHCYSGRDRTGLASTVYRLVVNKAPLDSAIEQLNWWPYGHLGWGAYGAMDEVFELYRKSAKGMSFKEWVREHYRPPASTTLVPKPGNSILNGARGPAKGPELLPIRRLHHAFSDSFFTDIGFHYRNDQFGPGTRYRRGSVSTP